MKENAEIWENRADENETRERLKTRYLASLRLAGQQIASLRQSIHDLLEWEVSRRDLVRWAVEAGYTTGYVRSLLSRILKDLGRRSRNRGGGRKVPREALALRILAEKHHGDKARKFLLAAYRVKTDRVAENRSVTRRYEA